MKTIQSTDAANLAHKYHDAMNMVSNQSGFHLPAGTSPRAALEGYLQACKMAGVNLHNEAWLTSAEAVVSTLMADRMKAYAQMLGKPTQIPNQAIADVCITAIESGIGYWAAQVTLHHGEGDAMGDRFSYQDESAYGAEGGFTIAGVDAEDTEVKWSFTKTEMLRVLAEKPKLADALIDETYDAEDADVIFQLSAFKEIVYG